MGATRVTSEPITQRDWSRRTRHEQREREVAGGPVAGEHPAVVEDEHGGRGGRIERLEVTCVFQTSANSCHWRRAGSDQIDRGSRASSRYQERRTQVPIATIVHDITAHPARTGRSCSELGRERPPRSESSEAAVERDQHDGERQQQRSPITRPCTRRPDLTGRRSIAAQGYGVSGAIGFRRGLGPCRDTQSRRLPVVTCSARRLGPSSRESRG